MTPDQIKTVQDSFDRVFPVKEELSETFYAELFAIAPGVRGMFPEDMMSQRLKLSDTLSYTVRNLHRPEVVEETIVGLARRHVKYGAIPDHFAPVGMALITALKTHLPGGMSDQEADAWLLAYTFISDMMIEEMPNTSDAA
ncbi:MAG: globin domain-containing protein [Roseobacter sp.]